MTGAPHELVVPVAAAGQRLDRFLAQALDQPRNQVQRWIQDGRVSVDERTWKPSRALQGGERVLCLPPEPAIDDRVEPEPGELDVLHEDGDIVVLNKPADLAMHPGAGRSVGTLAHRLVAAYPEISGVGGPGRPGIVHRLDIGTTGVVLVARSATAYRALSQDFAERRVEKVYLAICYGTPKDDRGTWTGPIGRHSTRRREMTVRPDGRAARTDYEIVASTGGVARLRILLGTGRPHPIRVHLKAAGHPLVGDPIYGEARWKALSAAVRRPLKSFGRPALHASILGFTHPVSGESLRVSAPPPDDLQQLWGALTDGALLPV
jgi:23S rRNA pseudouridine1911/1915/1917 synthase